MGLKVVRGEVQSANNDFSNILQALSDDSIKLSRIIDSFISSSPIELKGYGYDAVRGKLGQYKNAFNSMSVIFDVLANNIKSANNDMINYISPEEELSDEYKEQLLALIRQCEAEIDSLWEKINRMIEHYDYVDDGHGGTYVNHWSEHAYSEAERAEFRKQILEYKVQIAKFKKIIKKIDELPAKDAELFARLSCLDGDITSFNTNINSIDPSYFNSI